MSKSEISLLRAWRLAGRQANWEWSISQTLSLADEQDTSHQSGSADGISVGEEGILSYQGCFFLASNRLVQEMRPILYKTIPNQAAVAYTRQIRRGARRSGPVEMTAVCKPETHQDAQGQ